MCPLVHRQVSKDGSELHSSWFLASVDLLNLSNGYKSTFQYNSWLGTDYWASTYGTTITESSYMQVWNR